MANLMHQKIYFFPTQMDSFFLFQHFLLPFNKLFSVTSVVVEIPES
jgi:hypothetical protein